MIKKLRKNKFLSISLAVIAVVACTLVGVIGYTSAADATPTNIAPSATVTTDYTMTSLNSAYTSNADPTYLIDGTGVASGQRGQCYKYGSYDTSKTYNESIYFEWNDTYKISSIEMRFDSNSSLLVDSGIEYSLRAWNGLQWIDLGKPVAHSSEKYCYVWEVKTELNSTSLWLNFTKFSKTALMIHEVVVMGAEAEEDVSYPPTNVAQNATVQFSVDSWGNGVGYTASKITDGNTGDGSFSFTEKLNENDTKEVYISLGNTCEIDKIVMHPAYESKSGTLQSNGGFPADFTVSIWNGNEWVEVGNVTGYNGAASGVAASTITPLTFEFNKTSTNAIRVIATKQSICSIGNTYRLALGEIEAYGTANSSINLEKPNIYFEAASAALDTTETTNPVADGNSWTYTFDKAYKVNEIILAGGVPAQYQIELWDGTNWHTVDRRNSANFANGRLYIAVDEFASRALRISSNSEISVAPAFGGTLIVHGEELATNIIKPSEVVVPPEPTNMAKDATPTFNSLDTNRNVKLTDGDTSSGSWASTNYPGAQNVTKEIYLSLQQASRINEIRLYPRIDGNAVSAFPVDFSICVWDGHEWREVANKIGVSLTDASPLCLEFPETDTNAIRLVVTKLGADKSGKFAVHLNEIEAMGFVSEKTNIESPVINLETPNVAPNAIAEISADNKSVTYTFDKAYKVNEIIFEKGITFPAQYTITVWDGANWQKVASRNAADFGTRIYETIEPIDCRAICITSESNVSVLNKDSEIIIHGNASAINVKTPAEAGEVGVNAALGAGMVDQDGKTAEDSRVEMNVPQEGYGLSFNVSKLTDGVINKNNNFATTTYTNKASANEEIIIRFENNKAFALNKIKLFPRVNNSGEYQGGFPENFKISVWDGIQWVEVSSMTGYKADEKVVAFAMDNIVANAVKIEVSKLGKADNGTQYVLQLAEVEAWGVEANVTIDGPEDGVNAALSGTPVMNVPTWAANFAATELVDDQLNVNNNFATTEYAAAAATEEFVEITFKDGKAYEVDKIKLFPRVDASGAYVGGFPEDFVVSVWDGEEWEQVASKKNYESEGKVLVLELDEAVVCNAIKVDVTKLGKSENPAPAKAYVLQLAEIQAWGVASSEELITPDKAPEKGENAVLGAGVANEEGLPVEDSNRVFMNVPTEAEYGKKYNVSKLTDGTKVGDNFTTTLYVKENLAENVTEDIIITFADGAEYALHKVKLFPRVKGNGAYVGGFPEDFTLSVWNGTEWKEVAKETGYTAKADAYVLEEALKGNAIKISVSKLGASENFGQYVLQLAEVEAWGEKTGKTYALPVIETPGGEGDGEGAGSTDTNAALSGTVEMNVPKEGFGLSFPGSKLTDGATKGNSFATTAYVADSAQTESITVVFKDGAASKVDSIKIYPRVDKNGVYMGGFPEDFKVSVWDGTKWVEVASKTGYKGSAEVLSLDITPTICNAIKVDVTKFGVSEHGDAKPDSKYVLQLAEIEAYGESSNAKLQTPPVTGGKEEEKETGTNAALKGIVQFEVPTWGKNFPATMVVDGITAKNNNFTTSEYSKDAKKTEIIMVAFKEGAYEISKIKLFPRAAGSAYQGGFPEDFKVSVWNGTKWVEVASKTGYKSGAGALSLSIDKIVCNAVKVEATKLGASDKDAHFTLQLAEIEAWGEKSAQKLGAAPVSAGGSDDAKGEVTIDNERNLALNRPVYASSDLASYNAPISKVNDGNIKSYWASNDREFVKGEAQWAMVNLLNNFSINTVILGARQQALGFPIDFKIEVFYDGQWTEVVNKVGFVADEKAGYAAYEFKFPAVIGNKVRVSSDNFRKVGTSNSMVLSEIAVYGDSVTGNYVLPNENMLTPGALITATTSMEDYDYYIKHLIDGNFLTGWSSVPSTDPNSVQSVEIDMQGEVQLSEIQLKPSWGGNGFPIDFTISVFENGEWVDVYEAVDYEKPEDEAIQRFQFDTKKVTKFKITATKMAEEAGLYVWKMNEIMAYPSHTGDEFDPDRVAEVNSSLQFASAEVVPVEKNFFESVQVWKLIAGGVLFVAAIGGCVAIIASGKKKKAKEE